MSAALKDVSPAHVLVEPVATGGGFALRLPILAGSLRGYGWAPASGGKLMRVLLGSYERRQTRLFVDLIRPGDVVFDLGAAAGYYTLLAARQVGPTGKVLACEPDPQNYRFLHEHVASNGLTQVITLPTAVGGENGTARFGRGTGTGTGQLTNEGTISVRVRRLDDLAAEQRLRPTFIKLDVEGTELAVLHSGQQTIERDRPTIFLSTHNSKQAGVRTACRELLASWGYELRPILPNRGTSQADWLCQPR